jgi:N-6 DNA Methylase
VDRPFARAQVKARCTRTIPSSTSAQVRAAASPGRTPVASCRSHRAASGSRSAAPDEASSLVGASEGRLRPSRGLRESDAVAGVAREPLPAPGLVQRGPEVGEGLPDAPGAEAGGGEGVDPGLHPGRGEGLEPEVAEGGLGVKPVRLARSDFPDFNDSNKLGEGQAKVERLTNLVNIFASPQLDFSQNRADHDDILGDAYEYLMRHFATESGKSKGQFYTPAEVSRVIARVLGISPQNTKASTTAYDPTCGSGSLLLKVAAQAAKRMTLEGQEKNVTTAGLARMNMILHDFPTANILPGNTLAAPKFKDGEQLRTYDYVVANPPFSDKAWTTGLTPSNDPFQRFAWGEPPTKQGDYAYLLHIIRSLEGAGKGACILPHGVLFCGGAEATIRQQLVRRARPPGDML